MLVTTHHMEEAENCDRIALIYRGRMIAMGKPEELKTTQMRADVIEVLAPDAQEIAVGLAKLPQVRGTALFGAGVHAVVADASQAMPAVNEFLRSRGLAGLEARKITPSLEDVFVWLIEHYDAEVGKG